MRENANWMQLNAYSHFGRGQTTQIRYHKATGSPNDTFFNEIDDLEKSRQVWKVFLVFRAENVLFLCCGKARETKENVFNEVVYIFRGFSGFPKAQKQHI